MTELKIGYLYVNNSDHLLFKYDAVDSNDAAKGYRIIEILASEDSLDKIISKYKKLGLNLKEKSPPRFPELPGVIIFERRL